MKKLVEIGQIKNKKKKRQLQILKEIDTNSGSVGGDSMENKSFEGNLKEHKIREPRLRRPPTWMIDYMSGSELFDNEKTIQLALFADNDPITFDDAMKSSKCRKAMDLEIEAIVKNNT